jgi:hypothetical protein
MDIQADIQTAIDKSIGWEELPIVAIEKFGKELSVKTELGEIFIPARKFFEQYEFRARVFEELTIMLPKVGRKHYDKWLTYWTQHLMKDLKVDDSDLIDTVESYIESFLNETTETDERYLKMGRAVLLSDEEVAFRSNDIINKLKAEGFTVTNEQVYFILRRMNCETRRVVRNTLRVWVWKR